MSPDRVYLQIDGTEVLCEKQILIENSEYFKAMFQGNFIESEKNVIKLYDVDLKAMNIILMLLSDDLYPIKNEDLLIVLQTACMLQFERIRSQCVNQIEEILCTFNCLQIWNETEKHQIRPLFLHAKAMALEEFLIIKNTDCILDLTFQEVCKYLGHIYLKTDTEYSVLQAVMHWWDRHNTEYAGNSSSILIKLFHCIDWPMVLEENLKEIMTYPLIAHNVEIIYILCCILCVKNNKSVVNFSVECQSIAASLLNSKRRGTPKVPCILAKFVQSKDEEPITKDKELNVIYYDKFKRKRFYQILDNNKNDSLTTVFYDYNLEKFKKYFHFNGTKCGNLDGFQLMAHKQFVFLYGGEYLLGSGKWNFNLWRYNVIRRTWDKRSLTQYRRRHFQTCVTEDNLYIIGGTGTYRIIQESMFWYNFASNEWSKEIELPTPGIQLKCCAYFNNLLIVNLRVKCGFLFDDGKWTPIDIIVDDNIISDLSDYCIFVYKSLLYVKGNHLIVFDFVGQQLICLTFRCGISVICDKLEAVLCDNIVYTLYKQSFEDRDLYSLETYNLDSGLLDYVFKDKPINDVIDIDGEHFTVSSSLKMFPALHHSLVERDALINDVLA